MQNNQSEALFIPIFLSSPNHTGTVIDQSVVAGQNQDFRVLPSDILLSETFLDWTINSGSIFALYLPPWFICLGDEEAPSADISEAMDRWMLSVRRLLSSRKSLKRRLRFLGVTGENAESLSRRISHSAGLDKDKILRVLTPLLTSLENRMASQLAPMLESFFREHFRELTALHEAVVLILEGPDEMTPDAGHDALESSNRAHAPKKLEAIVSWYATAYRSKRELASQLEIQALKSKEQIAVLGRQKIDVDLEKQALELRAKSAEEEAELILMQLHQVQEELESYYLSNQDMRRIVIQSTQTIKGARCLALAE